jgi:uncharacterized protein YcfL
MRYILILLFLSACSSIDREIASSHEQIISVNLYLLKKLTISNSQGQEVKVHMSLQR